MFGNQRINIIGVGGKYLHTIYIVHFNVKEMNALNYN